jgi:plastocyanin
MSSHAFINSRPTIVMALSVLLLPACAKDPAPITIADTAEVSATIEAIDVKTRMVVLHASDGAQFALLVPEEVRNLEQVKVGDRVVTRYRESLGAELRKRGDGSGDTEAPSVATTSTSAADGAKPSSMSSTQTRQTVRITNVDVKNHIVTFYGSDGLARVLPVRTPQGQEFIAKLKTGDEVELTFTEAVAMTVEPMK